MQPQMTGARPSASWPDHSFPFNSCYARLDGNTGQGGFAPRLRTSVSAVLPEMNDDQFVKQGAPAK